MTKKKHNTRSAILESSKKLFSQRGFKATTIRDIAGDAGVAVSAISYHFNGKDGILLTVVEEIQGVASNGLFTSLEGDFNSLNEIEIRLKIFMSSLISFGIKNWDVVKILLTESYELRKFDQIHALSNFSLTQLEEFIRKAKNKDLMRSDLDEKLYADYLMALIMDQILHWNSKKINENIDFSIQEVRESWIQNILKISLFGAISSSAQHS